MGITRLYFLARDGYQFYQCAINFCKEWKIDLECRYLECSRYSLRIPMFAQMGESALDYICLGGMNVTFQKVMARAGIEGEEAQQMGNLLGFGTKMEVPMSYQQVQSLKKVLKACAPFMERMKEISRKAYPAAEAYLRQEGLFEDVEYALVDSGWTGSMQLVLQQMLEIGGSRQRLKGFYWGLYELPAETAKEEYYAYYFKPTGDFRKKVYFSNCLFETVFSAPHGMTISYEIINGAARSCYDSQWGSNSGHIEAQSEFIQKYVEIAGIKIKDWKEKDALKTSAVIYKLLKSFMGQPDMEEALWYGSYEFSDDVLEKCQRPVADKLNKKELKNNHAISKLLRMYGVKKATIQESAWYEASAVLSGSSWQWHQKQYRLYKYLVYIRKNIKRGK